jgi:KaiC/GvpD/RAD55 family RecA-like ATPase
VSTALERVVEALEVGGFRPKANGSGWTAHCPAHEDAHPSLSIKEGTDGRVLLKDFTGCSAEDVVAALGLEMSDLFDDPGSGSIRRDGRSPRRVAGNTPAPSNEPSFALSHPAYGTPTYAFEIRGVDGSLFGIHARFDPAGRKKTFAWWRDDKWGLDGAKLTDAPLYRSEHIAPEGAIVVMEGEKKADTLAAAAPGLSVVATVTGASGTPGLGALNVLRRRDAILWPDFDPPGKEHMKMLDAALAGVARSVRTIDVDALRLPEKGDAVEWLERFDATDDVGPLVLALAMKDEEGSSFQPVSVVSLLSGIYTGTRFTTCVSALDGILKGGFAPGFLFVVGGEPWIGKTTFLVQLADALSRAGVVVFIWATDEAAEGLALRLGQLQGEPQNELSPAFPLVLDRVRSAIGERVRFIPEACSSIELATEIALNHTPEGSVGALLLDSIQSVAQRTAEEGESERAAIGSVMEALNAAKARGLIVGATSELSRGGYASQDPSQRTRSLAAFAESRAIEYRSDIAMVMTKAGGVEDLARLEILKNRLSHQKGGLTLRLDHQRARLCPVDEEDLRKQTTARQKVAEADKQRSQERKILEALEGIRAEVAHLGLTRDEIRDRTRYNNADLGLALSRLVDSGHIKEFKTEREKGQRGTIPKRYRLEGIQEPSA